MKNIGVILRGCRPLTKRLEPVNPSQSLDFKLGEVNLCSILYQDINVLFSEAAQPFQKRNLICPSKFNTCLTIFLAAFRNVIRKVCGRSEPGAFQGGAAFMNLTAL